VQISISVRHGHLSEASQEKLTARAEKLARFFERLMAIEVTVDLQDEQAPQVDINVSAEHRHDFVAHCKSETLLGAFDGAVQKLEQQLRKYKERVRDRHRGGTPRQADAEVPVQDEADELDEVVEE
jgi:putative sigma-54 modulation protein